MATALTKGQIVDGYRYNGGDPNDPASWDAESALKPGAIIDDYRYLGGNPNDKKSWQPVKAEEQTRTPFAVANDLVITGANAAAGGVGAIADFIVPGNRVSNAIDRFIRQGEESQSDPTKARRAALQAQLQSAEGLGEEAGIAARYALENPLQTAAMAAGSFAVPGGVIKGAKAVSGAAGLGAKATGRVAMGAGSATGAAMAGGDAAGQAYDLVMNIPPDVLAQNEDYQALIAQGMDDAQAREALATSAARTASVVPAAIGGLSGLVGVERLLAGGKGFRGGMINRALKTGAVEAIPEGLEEGATGYSGRAAAAALDPSINPMKGVGAEAVQGAVVGFVPGAAIGALDASRQRQIAGEQQLKAAPDAGTAASAANAMSGSLDELTSSVDAYLSRTPAAPLSGAGLTPDGNIPAPAQVADTSIPALRARVDREAGLLAEAAAAGTDFERRMALEQLQAGRTETSPRVADAYADLTPMDERQAGLRLGVMRDEVANAGGNALALAVVPHPSQAGRFAIGKQSLPSLDLGPAVTPDVTPAAAQNRIETAALTGQVAARRAEDAPRQVVIDNALRQVEARGGVASPAEARIFQEAGLGMPYDRIDPNLAPALSTDETLTQATGIALAPTPRESGSEGQRQAALEQANAESMSEQERRAAANRAQAERQTLQQVQQASQPAAAPDANAVIAALQTPGSQRSAGQTLAINQARSRYSASDFSILERAAGGTFQLNTPERMRLTALTSGAVAQTQQPAGEPVTPATPPLMGSRVAERLGLPSGGTIVSATGAKFSGQRNVAPGATVTIKDGETEHSVRVVDPGKLGATGRLLQQIARIFGKRLVAFESGTLQADGFVMDDDNRSIYINSKSQFSPLAVFFHELTHLLKRDNPQAYAALEAVVKRNLREGATEYREGADLEEITSDLVGNRALMDADFLGQVFEEIAAQNPEGARGIILRMAAAINKAITAFKAAIKQSGFSDTEALVTDLDAVRAAVKKALTTYAQSQREPAMRMEAEQAQAEQQVDLTAGSRAEPAAVTFAKQRQTPEEKAQKQANERVGKAAANEQRRGVAVLASAKPGNNIATVTGRKGKDLARLHARAENILRAKPARDLMDSLGIKSYQIVTYNGSWQGEPELSFFITAKDKDGNPLDFGKTRGLGALLGWAFQQDAAITSEAVAEVADGASDIVPAFYFGKADGAELTADETRKAFKAFNAIGEDASVTPDGKALKFLFFGDQVDSGAHLEKLRAVAQKVGLRGESIAYNHGVLDSFQEEDSNGNVTEGYTRVGREVWDPVSPAGSPGIFERATDSLLVPYILGIRAEGFGFDYARWQQVNGATRQQRRELEAKVAAAEAANRHGLVPRLREKVSIARLPQVPLEAQITQKTTNANAVEQLGVLDNLLQSNPNPLASDRAWLEFEAQAFGSNDVPVAPRSIINQLADNGAGILQQLRRLTAGQIGDATDGFANGRQFRKLYESGRVPVETTGKLMMWSFLSRGVSPYVQEAMFLDAVRGVEPFVRAAAQGNFGPNMQAEYVRWAEGIARRNGAASPGNGTTHNLNAFGKSFLTRMSERMADGRTKLQYLHDMFSDPEMTGKQIRREFVQIGEGVGIDNKVISFTLLVIGHTDVVVLDRVQMKNVFDDGSFANYNLYDGTYQTAIRRRLPPSVSVIDDYGVAVGNRVNQITDDYGNVLDEKLMNKLSTVETFATLEQREGEADAAFDARVQETMQRVSRQQNIPQGDLIDERALKPGSGLANMTTGVRGLMLYETIENELERVLPRVYQELGRPQDASAGRWHWESWVVTSGQEASHGTLDALLHEVEGRDNPFADVTVKQGEYGNTDYGVRYARDQRNQQYYLYDDSQGNTYRFTPAAWREWLGEVKKVFPRNFKVTMNEDRSERTEPWFMDPRVDRGEIDAVTSRIGVPVNAAAAAETAPPKADPAAVADRNARDEGVKYSKRRKADPKKTVTAYKLFRVNEKKPGQLFPLFIGKNEPVEMGVWYDADDIPTKGFASRPGWHAGDSPMATHIGEKSRAGLTAPDVRPANQVWAEIEMSADKDWQPEANKRGTNAQGKVIAARADIKDQIPVDGFYRYKTNPNMTGSWLIGGSIKVKRLLSDAEVARINNKAGVADLPRQEPFDLARFGFGKTGKAKPAIGNSGEFDLANPSITASRQRTFLLIHGGSDFDEINPGFFGRGEPGGLRPLGNGFYGYLIRNSDDVDMAVRMARAYTKYAPTEETAIQAFKLTLEPGEVYFAGRVWDEDLLTDDQRARRDDYRAANELPPGPERRAAYDALGQKYPDTGERANRNNRALTTEVLFDGELIEAATGQPSRLSRVGKFSTAMDDAEIADNIKASFLDSAGNVRLSRQRTDTPQFKQWFGDSVVTGENGEPLVLYTGTSKDKDFDKFNIPKNGAWFTADPAEASMYAKENDSRDLKYEGGRYVEVNTASRVMPVYVRIEKPATLSAPDMEAMRMAGNYKKVQGQIFDRLRAQGYDGVDLGGGVWVVIGNANQVKSAIGNNGEFSRTKDKITASRRRNIFGQQVLSSWTNVPDTKMDDFLYTMQDKQIDTKRVVEAIKAAAGSIDDKWNAYLQEELYHGRTAKQTADFLNDELRPLLQEMQMRDVTMEQLEEYLHNRHAEERNIQIAKVNPNMPDGGSGIDTADARAYLRGLTGQQQADFQALARRVDAISANTRQLLVASGLETQDTIAAWEQTYGSYVPLFREDTDFSAGSGTGTGQGYSVRGAASRRATGSSRPVVDILANLAMQRERTIVRAQKTRVAQAVYGMAVQNPNTDFWLAIDPEGQKDPNKAIADLVSMGINPIDARNIVEEPVQQTIDPRTGLVVQRVNPLLRNSDNVLAVRIDGRERYVFFNNNDERAQRMVGALKNLDADQLGRVMGMAATVTRYFASINTQYNPIFGAINFMRDVQGATLNLTTTPIADKKAQVLADSMLALRGIYSDLRSRRKGSGPATGTWATLWEEFQREGGQTGFRDQFSKSAERAEALEKELKRITEGKAKQAGRAIFDWLSDYNETMENAVRLAAYKAAKEKGLSNQQAASVAKNLTVNFNRKGQVATQAGALYAFFNASVQGTTRLAETLRGPAGKKIMAGGLLVGVAQAMLLAAAGFDEDEPPDFVKERNLVIPTSDGKYITIPMPLGFNVIPNTSRVLTEWAMSGWRDPSKRIGQITGAFLEMFNPIGNAGWSVQTIAPTIADPLVALAENRDWTGKPIAKKDRSDLAPTPGYTRAKETASWFGKELAYYLNLASGGTKYKPGMISPTPDQIDYLIGQATGGVGREAMKIEQTITSSITGEELPTYKVPILGRFYGDTKSGAAESERFYNNIKRLNEHEAEIKGRQKNRDGGVADYRRENPEARLVNLANQVERDVQELRRRRRDLVEKNADPTRVKMIEERIKMRMKSFNDRVRTLRDQEPVTP